MIAVANKASKSINNATHHVFCHNKLLPSKAKVGTSQASKIHCNNETGGRCNMVTCVPDAQKHLHTRLVQNVMTYCVHTTREPCSVNLYAIKKSEKTAPYHCTAARGRLVDAIYSGK